MYYLLLIVTTIVIVIGKECGYGSSKITIPYNSGSLLNDVDVVLVVYGQPSLHRTFITTTGPNTRSMYSFMKAVFLSPYLSYLSEYDQSNYYLGNGTVRNTIYTIIPTTPPQTQIDDYVIRPNILANINNGNLPKPKNSTLYIIFFPSTIMPIGSCEQYLGKYFSLYTHNITYLII